MYISSCAPAGGRGEGYRVREDASDVAEVLPDGRWSLRSESDAHGGRVASVLQGSQPLVASGLASTPGM